MSRIVYFLCFITYLWINVNAHKGGILKKEIFNSNVYDITPASVEKKEVESQYISIDFKDSFEIYKIITNYDFTSFKTLNLDYYIEKGSGQILLLDTNGENTYYTVLDTLSTTKNKWISVTYNIPTCSNFNAIGFKNINSLKLNFRDIAINNDDKLEVITKTLNSDFQNWSWTIDGIKYLNDCIQGSGVGQYGALSFFNGKEHYYYDYAEFEIKETDLNMNFVVSSDGCGDYNYPLNSYTPEKDGEWYKYHIDLTKTLGYNCNMNRYSFMNFGDPIDLNIRNLVLYTNKDTVISNKNIKYQSEILLSMFSIFDENQDIYWTDNSKDIDNILFQPSRILAYNVNPDGYISFSSPKEYISPVLIEMDVLATTTHWVFELLDASGNVINTYILDDNTLSMNNWTSIKDVFEITTTKTDMMKSIKIYHNSSTSESIFIRNIAFQPYNPPLESYSTGEESCCPVKYCMCEIEYETIYVDDDVDIEKLEKEEQERIDMENKFYESISNEDENEENKEKRDAEDKQKRSLFNRIESFLNNIIITY